MHEQAMEEDSHQQEASTSNVVAAASKRITKRSPPGPSPLGKEISFTTLPVSHKIAVPQLTSSLSGNSNSPSSKVSPLDATGNKLHKYAVLLWRDLTIKLVFKPHRLRSGSVSSISKNSKSKVVQSLTGYALPGTLTAFIGRPCCGKDYLLQALAGKLPKSAKIYGEVLINGRSRHLKYGSYAFVRRGDELMDTLTVRENLYYSALLQLPACLPCAEKVAVVDATIADMDLEEFALMRAGGLGNAERRRLTIAMELLTRPHIIFCEAPINDLDSVAAFLVVASLKKLANSGCTVVITAEQTCSEVFYLFNNICLLSSGKAVFFGDASACLEHFASAGFPCPPFQNPSDHFLRAISGDLDRVSRIIKLNQDYEQGESPWRRMDASAITRTLQTLYAASDNAAAAEALVMQLSEKEGPVLKSRDHASFTTRVAATTWRSFLNMSRSFAYFWLRLLLYIPLMFSIASIFYKLDSSPSLIRERASAVFCMLSFIALLAIGGMPGLTKDMKVYQREKASGHTSSSVFVLGNFLSSIPYFFLTASICSSIAYFMMGFQPAFGLFMYFLMSIFFCLAISEGLMLVVASITSDIFAGIMIVLSIQVVLMLVSGYFRSFNKLPKPVWKYPASFAAFQTYAVEGLLENEYVASATLAKKMMSQSYPSWNSVQGGKWLSLSMLAIMSLGFRILLSVMLYLKSLN